MWSSEREYTALLKGVYGPMLKRTYAKAGVYDPVKAVLDHVPRKGVYGPLK